MAVSMHRCPVLENVNYVRRDKAGLYVGEGCRRSALFVDTKSASGASRAVVCELLILW